MEAYERSCPRRYAAVGHAVTPRVPTPAEAPEASSKTWRRSPNGPLGAADRIIGGHGEGDLILSRAGTSRSRASVERTSRFTLLMGLLDDRYAVTVRDAAALEIVELPEPLHWSLS